MAKAARVRAVREVLGGVNVVSVIVVRPAGFYGRGCLFGRTILIWSGQLCKVD
jgi:hypothetical protein